MKRTILKRPVETVSKLANRRAVLLAGCAALLGGCSIIPKTETVASAPEPVPTPAPSATSLPSDASRHRVALLVPLSGSTSAVGQALSNATTMALLDMARVETAAKNVRITTYDTGRGASEAARQAIADGNKLILGPLLASNVAAVQAQARPARVPAISFSNDTQVAAADVFLMGHVPEQSIRRSVNYARANGSKAFAALVPSGDYGKRSFSALENALRDYGGTLVGSESYARGNTSIISAAQRLRSKGGYDTVLVADGARLASQAAGELKRSGAEGTRILGTELWSGEATIASSGVFEGAVFSAVSNKRFKDFSNSYEQRFGSKPYRIATLGYDSVLLTLRIAQDWQVGSNFPINSLYNRPFLGLDGAFRFGRDGIAERALEVRRVTGGKVAQVDPAPATFAN
ncbi:MAG: penicillin-binding protein activator [Pseudomonadota bacterium]